MQAAHKRLLRMETTVATVLCGLVPSLLILVLFEPFPVQPWGAEGLVAFAGKSTLVAVLLMTVLMSIGTRAKVRRGTVPALSRSQMQWLRHVPHRLLWRAPLFAIGTAAAAAGVTALMVGSLDPAPLERAAFVVFNLVLGGLTGFVLTPLIQIAALADVAAGSDRSATGAVRP